ncbi:hypothetical protein Tco_0744810 [Tanacetum coccineum]
MASSGSSNITNSSKVSPDHPKDKSSLDASAKLTQAKLDKRSRDADLLKDKSGPESPPEFWRSWCVEGHLGDEGLCSRGTKLNLIFITAEASAGSKGLAECKASVSNLRRIQVKDIVKEVEDYLKTYLSAEMDISWYVEGIRCGFKESQGWQYSDYLVTL